MEFGYCMMQDKIMFYIVLAMLYKNKLTSMAQSHLQGRHIYWNTVENPSWVNNFSQYQVSIIYWNYRRTLRSEESIFAIPCICRDLLAGAGSLGELTMEVRSHRKFTLVPGSSSEFPTVSSPQLSGATVNSLWLPSYHGSQHLWGSSPLWVPCGSQPP